MVYFVYNLCPIGYLEFLEGFSPFEHFQFHILLADTIQWQRHNIYKVNEKSYSTGAKSIWSWRHNIMLPNIHIIMHRSRNSKVMSIYICMARHSTTPHRFVIEPLMMNTGHSDNVYRIVNGGTHSDSMIRIIV